MRNSKLGFLIALVAVAMLIPQTRAAVPVTVTMTPTSQVTAQLSAATYAVSISTPAPGFPAGETFSLSVSGLPSGASASFSPNPTTATTAGQLTVAASLTIDTGGYGNAVLYCPGIYQFTVTATGSMGDTGTSLLTGLTVTPTGPALAVTVTTDKSSYTIGQQVTILLSINRPAEGTLTISPPSGAPSTFYYQFGAPTSFPKTLSTTNQPIGRWTVSFQADDYCSGFSSGVAYFDLTPNTYDVSISLSGVPPSVTVNIQVDGQNQGSMTGSDIKTLSFPISSQHSIAVDQYAQGDQGVRYYSAQNTWTVSSAGSHTYNYQTQYYFTVGTDPDGIATVSGSGWYDAGTNVQTSSAPQALNGSAGTQYLFKGWMVDGALQTGNPISLTLDKPHKAIAKYQTQYQLIVDSPNGLGDPQGSGYYDSGSTAQFSVTSPVGILVQQVFAGWQGDYTGASPQGTIVMDKPHLIHASWTTSYMQLYIVGGVAAVVVIVAALLMWRRRRGPVTKPMPGETGVPPPPPSETPESPPAESPPPGEGGQVEAAAGEVSTGVTEVPTGVTEVPASTETSTCSSCGTSVPVGQNYCHNCGAKIQ
jgi:hypothetical protein